MKKENLSVIVFSPNEECRARAHYECLLSEGLSPSLAWDTVHSVWVLCWKEVKMRPERSSESVREESSEIFDIIDSWRNGKRAK